MDTRSRGALVALVMGGLVATVAPVAPAQASDDDVLRRGSCSAASSWKMKASPDDSGNEVEAEVDSDRRGQTWRWVLRRNGAVVARGTSRTVGPSGSFEVARRTGDAAGVDRYRFRAQNAGNGEVCRAHVRL